MGTLGLNGHSLAQKAKQKANIVKALELYQDGKSHREIAEILGIGRTTVAKYINIGLNEIATISASNIDIIRAELKERMLYIQQEAITAWNESKAFTKKVKKKIKKTGGKDFGDTDSIEVEEGHGDPRYLELAKDAGDSIAALFGVATDGKPGAGGETSITINQAKDGGVVVKTVWGTTVPQLPKETEPIEGEFAVIEDKSGDE